LKIESSLTSKTLFWNGINISYIYTRAGTITWVEYYYDYYKTKYISISLGASNTWSNTKSGLYLGAFIEYGLQRAETYDNELTKNKLIDNFKSDRNDLSRLLSFNLKFGFQF
jgi:hypothetical protein